VSECGRFVVFDALHLDRNTVEALGRWAADRGLRIQDAIQLALCAFNEGTGEPDGGARRKTPARFPKSGHDLPSPERVGHLEEPPTVRTLGTGAREPGRASSRSGRRRCE
jgi:hypothetical protein